MAVDEQLDENAIKQACAEVIQRFAYCADHGLYDEMAALFTDDGQFLRRGMCSTGAAEIVASMRERPGDTISRHLYGPPAFTSIDSDEIRATTVMTLYLGHRREAGPASMAGPSVIADVHDIFRITSVGPRIRHRSVMPVFTAAG